MRNLQTKDDAMGRWLDVLNVSDSRHSVVLAANTPKSLAIPTGARLVLFSATADFWFFDASSGWEEVG